MDLIITGRVSVNEQSLSIHLLNPFQFPRGSVARKEGGSDCIFLVVVINYVTDEI